MFELDKIYRDKIHGVVGRAVAQGTDGDEVLLQLDLNIEHLDSSPGIPQGHQLRWYPITRLEEVV